MNLNILADYGDLCGEGPVWDAEGQQLYWTDCGGAKFYRYEWASRRHECVKTGFEVNSFALNEGGGFVVANNSGLWLWDGMDNQALITDQVEGGKCQMNDGVADAQGRFLAGSWFYDPGKEYPLGKLMIVDTNGRCRILDEGIDLSNGLAFSPDNRTLYYADSARRLIYAYDYDVKAGTTSRRRNFVQVPGTEGLPDGVAVDAEGFVWAGHWYGSCVIRYDPDGKVERKIPVPAKQTSNLAFGGPDLTDIFITSAAKSEPMPIMPPAYDPLTGNFGGALYHVNLGIKGKAEYRARISLPVAN